MSDIVLRCDNVVRTYPMGEATVTAVPLTSGSSPAHFRVPVEFKRTSGLLLCDQLRTLDRSRLVKRLGLVDDAVLERALAVLRELFER